MLKEKIEYGTLQKKVKKDSEFLLGKDINGIKYYLEKPSWDCDWYWGFGYIQGYDRNRWDSHQHADNFLSEWFTSWNGSNPRLVETTFTEKEGWELCELFKQFYLLRETAEYYGRGKCHVANTKIPLDKKPYIVNDINNNRIPVITNRIIEILKPKTKL